MSRRAGRWPTAVDFQSTPLEPFAPQARVIQFGEGHDHEALPDPEATYFGIPPVSGRDSAETVAGQVIEELGKNVSDLIHGTASDEGKPELWVRLWRAVESTTATDSRKLLPCVGIASCK